MLSPDDSAVNGDDTDEMTEIILTVGLYCIKVKGASPRYNRSIDIFKLNVEKDEERLWLIVFKEPAESYE